MLERIEPEFPNVSFVKLDVMENLDFCDEMKVTSMPTLLYEVDGNEVRRLVGPASAGQIRELLTPC